MLGRSQSGYRSTWRTSGSCATRTRSSPPAAAAEGLLDADETLAGHPLRAASVMGLEASCESDFMEKS